MDKIIKSSKGNIGIFLVASRISARNLIAMPTSRNTKGYDIVILDPVTNTGRGIQVKCTDRKDYPLMASYIHDYESEIEEKIICDYVFVDIEDIDKPRFFIAEKEALKKKLCAAFKHYIEDVAHRVSVEQIIEKEKKGEQKRQLLALRLSDIIQIAHEVKTSNDWDRLLDKN